MPGPKRTTTSETYKNVAKGSAEFNDCNDCTVIAIAVATGTPYKKVHAILKRLGRKPGKGTSIENMKRCCKELGFKMEAWDWRQYSEPLSQYPKAWNARWITTHQPRRRPKVWAQYKDRVLIFHTARHVAAVKDAKVHDWSINNSLRVHTVYEVTPL